MTRTTAPTTIGHEQRTLPTVAGFESAVATVAFVDLAGFSAIADVYGDASALAVLGHFEELVREALGGLSPPIKWIGRGPRRCSGFPTRTPPFRCSDACCRPAEPSNESH